MSATANPNFELEQQALTSLNRINQICLLLQGTQALSSIVVLSLAYIARPLHLYGTMITLFTGMFAHGVVYYVLSAIARNVRESYYANPVRPQEWLVYATGRVVSKVFPYIFAHAVLLFSIVGMSVAHALSGHDVPYHLVVAWATTAAAVACFGRVALALRENSEYLACFVRGGGLSVASAELSEH